MVYENSRCAVLFLSTLFKRSFLYHFSPASFPVSGYSVLRTETLRDFIMCHSPAFGTQRKWTSERQQLEQLWQLRLGACERRRLTYAIVTSFFQQGTFPEHAQSRS